MLLDALISLPDEQAVPTLFPAGFVLANAGRAVLAGVVPGAAVLSSGGLPSHCAQWGGPEWLVECV